MINKIEQGKFYKQVYDMEEYTINDLLCSFFTKINECIDLSNESFKYLEWLKGEGLENETAEILNIWLEDGTLEGLINIEKFDRLSSELTNKINALIESTNTDISNLRNTLINQINALDETLSQKVNGMETKVNKKLEENETFINEVATEISKSMSDFETDSNLNFEKFKSDVDLQLNVFRNFIICTSVKEFKKAIEKCGTIPTIIYLVNGEYVLDETIFIPSNTKIVGLGQVTVKADGLNCYFTNKTNGNSLGYNGSKNIILENITFDGKDKADGLSMVAFAHAENISIQNCVFMNLHMWHMIEFNAVFNGVIKNCKFENYGNTGGNATEVIQLDSMISESQFPWFGGYDSTPNKFIIIEENRFYNIGTICIGNHSFKSGVTQKDIFIKNNYFDTVGTAINLHDFNNLYVSENTSANCRTFFNTSNKENTSSYLVISGNKHRGYYVNSTEGLGDERFVGINVEGNKGDYRVEFVTITDNHVTLCSGHGIGYTADYVTVANNKFYNIARNGIYHYGGLCGSIYGNCFKDTGKEGGRYAILVGNNQNTSSKGVVVNGNTIANLNGICVGNYSESVIVSNNIGNVTNNISDSCILDNNKTI